MKARNLVVEINQLISKAKAMHTNKVKQEIHSHVPTARTMGENSTRETKEVFANGGHCLWGSL